MSQKQVKIIGLEVSNKFGGLKATNLAFDSENRLTIFKGEVGAGKTTLNKAMRLTTQGSGVLKDKSLYGDIDLTTQLSDGDTSIFVGCRTVKNELTYFLYTLDENGKKIKDVVVDGQKLTPANYLKSLQTALTWRLDELTSENPTTQRNILLELYSDKLEKQGVIFDKNHSKYVGSILDKIEKAKNKRSLMDMKRKEVGGIADDMLKKGISYEERLEEKDVAKIQQKVDSINAKITLAKTDLEQHRENQLGKLKIEGLTLSNSIKKENDKLKKLNLEADLYVSSIDSIESTLNILKLKNNSEGDNPNKIILDVIKNQTSLNKKVYKEIKFDEDEKIISKSKDFKDDNNVLFELLTSYKEIKKKYKKLSKKDLKPDVSNLELELEEFSTKLKGAENWNKNAKAVNSFHDWRESNDKVNEIKKDYYLKLTQIKTGVKGLHICTETVKDKNGNDIPKNNDIFLMYNGEYDSKYFNNENKELRKLSSYSGTQKPMICLLIQNYLLSKKSKVLPYLWIDNVPIDNKTKKLLDKMANELDLWLFVNWTGDFKAQNLKDGEILIENGELLLNES